MRAGSVSNGDTVRRWARTGATQRRILDAATEVFAARGFTAATMADVVAKSGASIGSIYHHFGGKSELFLAIFEQVADDVERRIEAAMQHASRSGPDGADPRYAVQLHVRAYLEAMWDNRCRARVLSSGDTPAGFETVRRDWMSAAFRRWLAVLPPDTSLRSQLLSRLLMATMAESSLLIADCENPNDVAPIIDTAIEWIARLTE
ncbi:TetR family transcriptional regulator [Mycobacterium kansasii]|nr:TetR family transcriptional regulator [Mycobacterium kansasii]